MMNIPTKNQATTSPQTKLSLDSIAEQLIDQAFQIDRARAVLLETMDYFEQKKLHAVLPLCADQIFLLLSVVNELLFPAKNELDALSDRIYDSMLLESN